MFKNANSFNQNLDAWNVENCGGFGSFLEGATLSIVNYDALLSSWANQTLVQYLYTSGGNSKYSAYGESNKQGIQDTFYWVITDGGLSATLEFGRNTELITIPANTVLVPTFPAVDPEGDAITYAITGGTDAALFTINTTTGVLEFLTIPTFARSANNTTTANEYVVEITASANGETDMQTITVIVSPTSTLTTENELLTTENTISIYPNPVQDNFKIRSNKALDNASISIYNALGKKVKTSSHLNEKINIVELQSGIYFYSISKDKKVIYNGKIIKE